MTVKRTTAIAAVAAMTLSALATAAETTLEAYLGSWTGHGPNAQATAEIRIERIDGADVYATYCRRHGRYRVYDLHPDGPTPGTLTAEGVTFEAKAEPKNLRWRFTPTADGGLELSHTNAKGKTRRLTLARGEGPCLSRVAPRSGG